MFLARLSTSAAVDCSNRKLLRRTTLRVCIYDDAPPRRRPASCVCKSGRLSDSRSLATDSHGTRTCASCKHLQRIHSLQPGGCLSSELCPQMTSTEPSTNIGVDTCSTGGRSVVVVVGGHHDGQQCSLGRAWTAWPPEYEPADVDARQGTVASVAGCRHGITRAPTCGLSGAERSSTGWAPFRHTLSRGFHGRPGHGPRLAGISESTRRIVRAVLARLPWNETTTASAGTLHPGPMTDDLPFTNSLRELLGEAARHCVLSALGRIPRGKRIEMAARQSNQSLRATLKWYDSCSSPAILRASLRTLKAVVSWKASRSCFWRTGAIKTSEG